jgi:hypothetical protein
VTVKELQAALQAAVDRGLDPETTVVLATDGWYQIATEVADPSQDSDQADMWFTIYPGDEADSRFTPGGRP